MKKRKLKNQGNGVHLKLGVFFILFHLLQRQQHGCVVVVSYWMGNRDAPNSGVSVLALTLALPTKPMQGGLLTYSSTVI